MYYKIAKLLCSFHCRIIQKNIGKVDQFQESEMYCSTGEPRELC